MFIRTKNDLVHIKHNDTPQQCKYKTLPEEHCPAGISKFLRDDATHFSKQLSASLFPI